MTQSPLHEGSTELLERAKALEPLLREQAEACESQGKLTDEVVAALVDGGFFGMWVPLELGGSELSPRRSLEVLEQLAYGDASTAWVVMATGLCSGAAGAYLPDEGAAALFAGGVVPIMAGQGTKPGVAVREAGGFRVSGEWSFASGVKHASYLHTAAVIEGTHEARIFNPPVSNATLTDNWDVMGLRATGSIDYTLDSVFIADAYSHPITINVPERGGAVYRLGIINFAGICHSGWALGVSRRMLDELRELARERRGRAGTYAESDSFHEGYARVEARHRAARALLFETWADIESTLAAGDALSVRQETLNLLGLANVTAAAAEVTAFVYRVAGTTALRAGAIQRYYRDMHAGTQHITSAPPVLQACGRELAGLAEGKHWAFLNLVDDA